MLRSPSPYAALPVLIAAESGTSTTSLAIEVATKVFTIQRGRVFISGDWVLITSDADPDVNWMHGPVTSYSGTTLTVDVQNIGGGGTYADWTIRRSGPRGAEGIAGAPGTSRTVNVRLATTAATLLSGLEVGDTVDGVTLVSGDIVLRHLQATTADNGIYTVQSSGSAVRNSDFNTYASHSGVTVVVEEGTRYAGTNFQCVSSRSGTLGVTAITFVPKASPGATLDFRRPIVSFDNKIFVPEFYWRDKESGSFGGPISPSDGSLYWELDASTTTTSIRRYYADISGTAAIAVVGSTLPLYPSRLSPEIGRSLNGTFQSAYDWVGGAEGRGVARNQFAQGNDPDHTSLIASGASVVDVVDTTLNGMDILRGVTQSVDYSAYGMPIERTTGNDWIFARFYVLADNDSASFAFDGAGIWGYPYGGLTALATASLEKIHATRVRSYIAAAKTTYDIARVMIGIRKDALDASNYTVCNIQFAMSQSGPIGWIGRGDYDKPTTGGIRSNLPAPLVSNDLYLIDGLRKTLFLENIVPLRDQRAFYGSLELDDSTIGAVAYEVTGPRRLDLDSSKFPLGTSTAYLRTWPEFGSPGASRFEKPITVHKVAGSGLAKTPKVLVIGDSIDNRSLLNRVDAMLTPAGVTVTWVGSIGTSTADGSVLQDSGPVAEARESRGLGGLVNCTSNCTASTPLPPGDEALYVDSPDFRKSVRIGYNPFLRPKAGDGSEDAIAQNGQVFDFDNYITRLSGAGIATVTMPDIVIVDLLTNDWTDDSLATVITNIQFAVPRIADSIFDAKSDMKLAFSVPVWAESYSITDGQQKWAAMIAELIAQVNACKVANPTKEISVLSSWAHMSPYAGWLLDTGVSVDDETGYRWATYTDSRHSLRAARNQNAESKAAYIANVA